MVEHSGVASTRALDVTYAALAHPVRRALISSLREGEGTVTRLAGPFDISLAAVSKHIQMLEGAGLVRRDVLGREHHLLLDAGPLSEASGWLETYREFWEGRLDALESLLAHRRPRGR
jgi:DNA-binding transcriptional ArsR family regulator